MARPPKITNREILTAARQVFLEQGASASTLAIAQKAGISEAAIFKRFTTKQALFLAAMGIDEQPAWIALVKQHTPSTDFKAELTEVCGQMLAFYREALPRVMMLMVQNKMPHPPLFMPPPVRDSQLLTEYFARAIALGYLRPCSAATLAHLVVGAIVNHVVAHNVLAHNGLADNVLTHKGGTHKEMSNLSCDRSDLLPSPPTQALAPNGFAEELVETLWAGIAPGG